MRTGKRRSLSESLRYSIWVLALATASSLAPVSSPYATPGVMLPDLQGDSLVVLVQGTQQYWLKRLEPRNKLSDGNGTAATSNRLGVRRTTPTIKTPTARSIQRLNQKGLSTGIASDPRLKAPSKTGTGIDKARIGKTTRSKRLAPTTANTGGSIKLQPLQKRTVKPKSSLIEVPSLVEAVKNPG